MIKSIFNKINDFDNLYNFHDKFIEIINPEKILFSYVINIIDHDYYPKSQPEIYKNSSKEEIKNLKNNLIVNVELYLGQILMYFKKNKLNLIFVKSNNINNINLLIENKLFLEHKIFNIEKFSTKEQIKIEINYLLLNAFRKNLKDINNLIQEHHNKINIKYVPIQKDEIKLIYFNKLNFNEIYNDLDINKISNEIYDLFKNN